MGQGPVILDIDVVQDDDWECGPFRRYDSLGNPLNFSGYGTTDLEFEIRDRVRDEQNSTQLMSLTLGNGGIILQPTLLAATAISTAFEADNVIRTNNAQFLQRAVLAGDVATIAVGSNAGTYRVASKPTVFDNLLVENIDGSPVVFTAEVPGGATVGVENDSRFLLQALQATTDIQNYTQDTALYAIRGLVNGLRKTLWRGNASLIRTLFLT